MNDSDQVTDDDPCQTAHVAQNAPRPAGHLREVDALHASIAHGRLFDDSAEIIRELREERTGQLCGEEYHPDQIRFERLLWLQEQFSQRGWANGPDSTEILRQSRVDCWTISWLSMPAWGRKGSCRNRLQQRLRHCSGSG